jgi:hypothetical protein
LDQLLERAGQLIRSDGKRGPVQRKAPLAAPATGPELPPLLQKRAWQLTSTLVLWKLPGLRTSAHGEIITLQAAGDFQSRCPNYRACHSLP